MANSNFNLAEEERRAVRPDIPQVQPGHSNLSGNSTRAGSGGASDTTPLKEGGVSNSTNAGRVSPSDLSKAEGPGSFWRGTLASSATSGFSANRIKNFLWGSNKRKRTVVGGSIAGTLIGGSLFGLTILSGPAELVQLSAALQHPFSGMNHATDSRFGKLLRFAGARNVGEARLGQLGRQYLRPLLSQLADMGIEYKSGTLSDKATIDPFNKKLEESFPELKGRSLEERKTILEDKFSVPSESPLSIDAASGKLLANNSTPLRAVKSGSVGLLPGGRIQTYMQNRVLGRYLGLGRLLFNPYQKQKDKLRDARNAQAVQKAEEDRIKAAQAENVQVQTQIDQTVAASEGTAVIRDSLKQKLQSNGVLDTVMKGVLVQAVVCTFHGAVNDAVALNHAAVVAPAIAKAVSLVAVGEKLKSGDLTAEQVGATEKSLTDSKGRTVWQAKSLRALEGQANPSGPDLPAEYSQAFAGTTSADELSKETSVNVLGLNITGIVCSPPAQAATLVATLLGLAVAFPVSGGSDVALFVGGNLAKGAAFYEGFKLLGNELTTLIKDNAVVPKLLSGPLGGNIAAYGARAAANTAAMATGGIELANTATQAVAYQQQRQEDKQFRSESFFARTFNIYDYRSLAGKIAASITPSFSQNIMNFATGFTHMGSLLTQNLASVMAHASAAAQPYNWGFPIYGIPDKLLNDKNVENPYDNAKNAQDLLKQTDFIYHFSDRIQNCFGSQVDPSSGNITALGPSKEPNPNSQAYTDSHCSDTSDPMWKSIVMFVLDMRTMQSAACYMGDDQSCSDLGYETSGGTQSQSSGTTISAGGYTNPFPSGWTPSRLDMGYDGTFARQIVAPFSGTITYASTSFSNWGGYIEIKSDQALNIPSNPGSQTLYFAEGVKPAAGISAGTHVTAGQPIADAVPSVWNGITGNIEWGVAQDGSAGSPTNTYVYGQCGSAGARQAVMDFTNWAKQTFHLQASPNTASAGCP